MENEIQKKKLEKTRDYHYIYFNEIHDIEKEIKIEISKEYEGFDTLEIFDGKNPFKSAYNSKTVSKIYRFKLYPDLFEQNNQNKNIIINFEQNNKKAQFILNIENIDIDIHKDYFEYDLNKKVKEIDFIKASYEQQFEIYNDFIQNTLKKKQDSKENEEFIISTQKLISGDNANYSFYFYLLILKKCLDTKMLQRHILLFDPEKINEIMNIPEEEKKEINIKLNNRVKKVNEIIIDDIAQKQKIKQEFYFIIFFFNNFFNKIAIKRMLDNKETFESIYKKLFIYSKLFQGLVITNDQADKLIERAETFNQILCVLNYLGNSFPNLIKILIKNFKKISEIITAELKEKKTENKKYIIKIERVAKRLYAVSTSTLRKRP